MAEEISTDFYKKKPFGVRLTQQDIDFIEENYNELFDGDKDIQPRKAFMLIAEKAMYTIKKNTASQPKDLERIAELENQLKELQDKHNLVSSQLNSAVELKNDFERKYNEVNEKLENLPEKTDSEPVTIERELTSNERLLVLTNYEAYLLALVENHHKTDAKTLLIDRLFKVYQERGPGDFNIVKLSASKIAEIKNLFKTQQK
jgi:hypothetical protein